MTAPGVLTVQFEVDADGEQLVNSWYDEHHIPDRLAIPGFRGVSRFRSLEGPLRHLTVWEVDDVEWPFDPAYRALPNDRWTDRIGHLRGPSTRSGWVELPTSAPPVPAPRDAPAPGIRLVRMEIPGEHAADFNAWYEEDHIPALMSRPEYLGIRRFAAREGGAYLAMWYLSDCHLHVRPGFVASPPTDWGRRMAAYRTAAEHSSWEEIASPAADGSP